MRREQQRRCATRAGRALRASALALLLALGSTGCVERVVDFHVRRLLGLRVTDIDGRGFSMRVRCELENPNLLAAEVTEVRFRNYAGAHLLGEGRFAGPIHAPARQRFVLEVPVRVTYASLPPDFPARVSDGSLRLRTEVGLRAKTSLGTYRMALASEDRARVAEALEVAIRGSFSGESLRIVSITLRDVGLRRLTLRARIRARNLFPFPVRIRGGSYRIAVNGTPFAEGQLERPIALAARGEATAETDLVAAHGAVGSAVIAMMGEEPRFRLQGTLWIDPVGGVSKLPLDVEAGAAVFSREE